MRRIRPILTAMNSVPTLSWLLLVGLCGFVLFVASQFVSLASPWNWIISNSLLAVATELLAE